MIDYNRTIKKYIKPASPLYDIYMFHVESVANRAMEIAKRVGLAQDELDFIYEAGMLHDIGIVQVYSPEIHCFGERPYIQHLVAGYDILSDEGLPRHAGVALRHCTPNFSMDYIKMQRIPLPDGEYSPQDKIELIVAYADLFYSKSKKMRKQERKLQDVFRVVEGYEKGTSDLIYELAVEFGEIDKREPVDML